MSQNEKDFYNRIGACYDSNLGVSDATTQLHLKFIEKNVPIKRVLDLGCGTGRILIPLLRKGFDMFGLDISEQMLACLKNKLAPTEHVDLRVGSAIKLPYNDAFFDGIICCHSVLSHIPLGNPRALWAQEVYRILVSGGIFIADVTALWRNCKLYEDERERSWKTGKKTSFYLHKPTGAQCELFWWDQKEMQFTLKKFASIEFFGRYNGEPYNKKKSPMLLLVARK